MGHSLAMLAPTQQEVLEAAVAGDRDALEQIARAWWPEIRRWCLLNLGDPVKADDASQETLVRLVRFIRTYDPTRPFAPWLRHLAKNTSRDIHSRTRQRAEQETHAHDLVESPRSDRELDIRRGHADALRAFSILTPRQREVTDLCDRQGMNATEAGEVLDIAPSTVRVLLRQARVRLRTHLLRANPELADLVRER